MRTTNPWCRDSKDGSREKKADGPAEDPCHDRICRVLLKGPLVEPEEPEGQYEDRSRRDHHLPRSDMAERPQDRQNDQDDNHLAHFHATIEGKERGNQSRRGEVHLLQDARKSEAVDKPEERSSPSIAGQIFRKTDSQGQCRLCSRQSPTRPASMASSPHPALLRIT